MSNVGCERNEVELGNKTGLDFRQDVVRVGCLCFRKIPIPRYSLPGPRHKRQVFMGFADFGWTESSSNAFAAVWSLLFLVNFTGLAAIRIQKRD